MRIQLEIIGVEGSQEMFVAELPRKGDFIVEPRNSEVYYTVEYVYMLNCKNVQDDLGAIVRLSNNPVNITNLAP